MRFYVWMESGGIKAAWLVYRPNSGAADCTDMDDQQFQDFIASIS